MRELFQWHNQEKKNLQFFFEVTIKAQLYQINNLMVTYNL